MSISSCIMSFQVRTCTSHVKLDSGLLEGNHGFSGSYVNLEVYFWPLQMKTGPDTLQKSLWIQIVSHTLFQLS